jgi:tryptophan synthase alpha chain
VTRVTSTEGPSLRGPEGETSLSRAFANSGKRAALMPYLMGGYPDLETSLAIGHAYIDGGADIIELGVPFSDPLADGPVIHAAGTAALIAGATVDRVLDV